MPSWRSSSTAAFSRSGYSSVSRSGHAERSGRWSRANVSMSALLGRGGQRRTGDDDLLHLRRPLVDAQRANLAVEALDGVPGGDAEAAEELHGGVDRALGGL